ncbi:hypothetical protein [Nocardia mexicana]|uniref:Uncharacterized protein n=1 Tax=Nocardia mexicana TaxID=279262 RepID=A0A370HCA0_9NOCA|nr:hypothetical protein [Nocardia mexicana]RDI54562.1 hypothetical protein DFR68_102690 [Nocardia mexicana]
MKLGRLVFLSMIPFTVWLWVLALLAVAGVLTGIGVVIVLAAGESTSSAAADFRYQCDSAVGPDPSATETSTPSTSREPRTGSARETTSRSATPTTNPYAELTFAPDDDKASAWQRSCVTAMRSAPYQLPALQTANSGPAVDCARDLALAQLNGRSAAGNGATGGVVDDAALAQYVIAQASAAGVTWRCELTPTTGTHDMSAPAASCAGSAETGPTVVILPSTIAGQAVCGQRVDPFAMSPGDLVFWDYRSHAPTRVGVAVDAIHVVTSDPSTGQVVEQLLPSGRDVRVKRVLKGET